MAIFFKQSSGKHIGCLVHCSIGGAAGATGAWRHWCLLYPRKHSVELLAGQQLEDAFSESNMLMIVTA